MYADTHSSRRRIAIASAARRSVALARLAAGRTAAVATACACLAATGCAELGVTPPDRSAGIAPPTVAAARLSAPELYAAVAPGIAYIETALTSGTGVRVASDLLVTNAHVLWPYDAARVVFPDGTEIDPAPVVAQDLLADLAVIDVGALGDAVAALPVGDGNALPVGEDVYLVGYPSEVELFPQPALTRGVVSRHRHWDAIEMPFVQTDADIAGGQSGGALVAPDGSVVGFSSMIFGDSDFGLALSGAQALARVDRLVAGEDVDGLAPRSLPRAVDDSPQRASIAAPWEQAAFVLEAPYGTWVDVSAESPADAWLQTISPFGDLDLDLDATPRGSESGEVRIQEHGPYFVVVELDRAGEVTVDAAAPLARIADPDDGELLVVGERTVALMDFPGDADVFRLHLRAGQRVEVTVDTVNFGPDLTVYRAGSTDVASPLAEGVAGGPLGMTAIADIFAPDDGDYAVVVRDRASADIGGYLVLVR